MRKVQIMITGHEPREVFVRPGETFVDLTKRLNSPSWPLLQVGTWYHNGTPAARYLTFLRDGDILAGVGRKRPLEPKMVTVLVTGRSPRRTPIRSGETLDSLVTLLSTPEFPLGRVDKWYVNSDRVIRPEKLTLRHGDLIAGAPRPHCD